nr:unnamed protein product [Callosobruchus analis]
MEEQMPAASQRYCLRWNYHTNNILQMISQHHMKEKFVDVVLVCEYHYIKVHRFILSACSVFFESLLDSQVGQVFQPYIVLSGVKLEHLKYIIDFMYTGEINVLDKDIEEVLALGEKFKVKGLCSVVLREKVNLNPQEAPTKVNAQNISQPSKPESAGNDTLPNGGPPQPVTPDLLTPVASASTDDKETTSEDSTQLANNVKASSKIMPKIQVRPPSVINASAAQTNTEPLKDLNTSDSNKQKVEKSIELSIVSSGQRTMSNISKVATKLPQQAVPCRKREAETSSRSLAESSVVAKDSVLPKGQKLKPETQSISHGATQSNIVFDISKRPGMLRKGVKRKLTSPENVTTNSPASGSSDSRTNKTFTAVKFSPSKPKVVMSPENSVDEVMEADKEEILEPETSNRTILTRDRMDPMKNGTQVPKKVLEEEQKRSKNPFMILFLDENKREISLRISQMWKSLDPDSRRTYYRRARQAVKEECTSAQSMEMKKPMDEDVTVNDLPQDGTDIEIIICGDEDSNE